MDPCTTYNYGEAEDYVINIIPSALRLNLHVFLEGPFNGTAMNTTINGLLPLSQPFSGTPWNYSGTENVGAIPATNIVDWVLIDLRDASSPGLATPATSIAKQAAFLRYDGQVVDLSGNPELAFPATSINNHLYVAVFPRNHLPVISGNALSLSGGLYTYNFSTAASQALGGTDAQKYLGASKWGLLSGNSNGDYYINILDRVLSWNSESGKSGYLNSDLNLDGNSDNQDKNDEWVPNNGKTSYVPQ